MTTPDLPPVAPPGLEYLLPVPGVPPVPSGWLLDLIAFVVQLFGM